MSIGLPSINIIFQQKAVSAIERSNRGICLVIVQDATAEAGVYTYRRATDLTDPTFSKETLETLKRAFTVPVNKLIVCTVKPETDFDDVAKMIENVKYNWICSNVSDYQSELVSYIQSRNAQSHGKKYQAIVYGTTANNKAVHILKNATVTTADGESVSGLDFLPQLAATCAYLPMNRSLTYYTFSNLTDCDSSFITIENDASSWIDKGNLVLINDDDEIKIARGVNSLTQFDNTNTEDMRKIIIVESMNLILEDIYSTFKNAYIGKMKNSYDNQSLFISAVNAYFRDLEKEEILDPAFDNEVSIDVEAQRNAWLAVGKTDADEWTDAKVKEMSFKSTVFLAGKIKILDAIEDLTFSIAME